MQAGEAARLVAEFLASRGITRCPARYAAAHATRTLTMAAYLTVIGTALGLVATWAALAALVA